VELAVVVLSMTIFAKSPAAVQPNIAQSTTTPHTICPCKMKTARAPEVEHSFMIEENRKQDDQNGDYQESPVPEGTRELGKIYLEAKVQDDFTDNLLEVGCRSLSNVLSSTHLSRYTAKLCGSSLFILSVIFL
jgi:hypothetical protein